jgi:hypothetical protein
LALLGTTVALATERTATVTIPTTGTRAAAAKVRCPLHDSPVFGGFKTSGANPANPAQIYAFGNGHYHGRVRDFFATFSNPTGSPATATAIGECAPASLVPTLVSAFHIGHTPDGTFLSSGSAAVSCPRGTRVLLGEFGGDPGLLITSSKRASPNSWRVSGFDAGAVDRADVNVAAYCEAGLRASPVSRATTIPAHSAGALRVRCPAGTRLVSDGFSGDATDAGAQIVVSQLYRTSARSIHAGAANIGAGPGQFTAFAYCSSAPG